MSETVSTEMATLDDLSVVTSEVQLDNVMKSLSGASTTIVSTVQGDDFEARTKVVNAVVNAEPLEDSLGKVIELVDWVAQIVTFINEDKVEEQGIRTVLIAADGSAFSAMSKGVNSALANLVGVLGHPNTWPNPVKVVANKRKGRNGYSFTTLNLA